MWALMKDVARELGVRTDVPFKDLTDEEKDIVYHGPAKKVHILYKAKSSNVASELDFTYYNAIHTVENALAKVKDEKGMKRVERFLKQGVCPDCGGTRLSHAARTPRINGKSLDEVCAWNLTNLKAWVDEVPDTLSEEMQPMATSIVQSFDTNANRLLDLGLHPLDIETLLGVFDTLVKAGATVIVIEHDLDVIRNADYLIDMGPYGGELGGTIVATGTPEEVKKSRDSITAKYI